MGAGHLKIGDTIKQADGTTGLVANVITVEQTREMFNLTVSEAHTYYVGQDGWLVHNCPDAGDAAKAFTQPGWIKKDLYSELSKTLDKDVLKKFEDGLSSFTSGQGGTGIKKLSGGGVKIGGTTYEYELKILGKGGGGRIYGNLNENGQVIFERYRPQH
ncbi:polymorphic toxin-type HINT domain-containing protein [Deinococcus xianganensis]|uniref:polymorphic toxin-type HINT domain-containing protein n=1 Tax=Deinococcus xianganensis TaxID=1507289 RepID=UPI00301C300E